MKQPVLIADGNPVMCHLYAQFLASHGFDVTTSRDGLDCLVKLRQAPPAALVLDRELNWGGSDGVLAWLREDYFMTPVPVILLLADKTPATDELLQPPVVQCLPKPFVMSSLLDGVRSAFAQQRKLVRSASY